MSDEETGLPQIFRDLVKGGGVVFVGRVAELGLSFVSLTVIARLIGASNFGLIAIGSTMLSMLTTVSILGLDTGVGRFLPRYESDRDRRGVLRSALRIAVPVTVVVGLAVVLSANALATRVFDNPKLVPVLVVFGLAVPFAAVVELWVGTLQGSELVTPKVVMEQLSIPAVRLVAALLVIALGFGVEGIATAYWVASVVASCIGVYYLRRRTDLLSRGEFTSMHRRLLSFSAPLVLTIVMNKVLNYIDTFLIAGYMTAQQVGLYKVAYPLASLLFVGLESASFLFMPVVSRLESDGRTEELRRVYQVVTKWIFVGTLPLFIIVALFPGMTLTVTFGDEYVPGARALSVLALGFFITVIVGPNKEVLTSAGETRFIMITNAATAILNLALNLVLIPRYGIVGAAVATAVSFGGMNLAYAGRLYRQFAVHPFATELVRPGIVSLALALVLEWVTETYLSVTVPVVVAMFVVFVALYGVIILRFGGIQQEEVQLVLDVENKFDVDLGPLKRLAKRLM